MAPGSPAEQAVLTQWLGVLQLGKAQLYRAAVLPWLALLGRGTAQAVMLEVCT